MGIGIATGDVIVGNIGSEKRTKYGAVGSPVNVAGRIESYTLGGELLICQETFAGVTSIVHAEAPREVHPKGLEAPIRIRRVLGIGGAYGLELPDHAAEWTELETEVSVRFGLLDGKQVSEGLRSGSFSALSQTGAWLRSEDALPELTDLRIEILDGSGAPLPGAFYAKVVRAAPGLKGRPWCASPLRGARTDPGRRPQRAMSGAQQAALPESYAEFDRAFILRRWGVLVGVGIVAWSSYLVRDVAAFGWSSDPVAYRVVGVLILVGALLIRKSAFSRRHLDAVLVVSLCAMTFTTLAAMAARLGDGCGHTLRGGSLRIALILPGMIVPARWRVHVLIQLRPGCLNRPFATPCAQDRLVWGSRSPGLFHLRPLGLHALQRSEFEARRELERVSRERRAQLDALERVGISATSTDPAQQARSALDEMIRALGVGRAWLYRRGAEGRSRFQIGRDAERRDLGEPSEKPADAIELPLRMRDQEIGSILLVKNAGAAGVSASDDHFLRALASHVASALETVRSTEELRVARDRALDAGRAKDAFLQTMSHELRTPLNAMIGWRDAQEDLGDAGDLNGRLAGKIQAAATPARIIADILTHEARGRVPRGGCEHVPVADLISALEAGCDCWRSGRELARFRDRGTSHGLTARGRDDLRVARKRLQVT
jgi:signal transduction histidine kinase